MQTMSTQGRISQRAPRSCEQCSRRKLKCSKQIPCSNCTARGELHKCHREPIVLSKHVTRPKQVQRRHRSDRSAKTSHWTADEKNVSLKDPLEPTAIGLEGTVQQDKLHREATQSLESLVWGSHEASISIDRLTIANPCPATGALSAQQEQQILNFHQDQVACLHNVVHISSFQEECLRLRSSADRPADSWMSLYYALMSVGLYYMSNGMCESMGIYDHISLARTFYHKSLDALNSADFMASHSQCLQAICLLLPCAHAFGDSKRIIALLSSAGCIAQLMQFHKLVEHPSPSAPYDAVRRHEIKKRVWWFLVTQDSYLFTFKRAYSIVLHHCKTSLPANCSEVPEEMVRDGRIQDLPLSMPTQTSYMTLQSQLATISRKLNYDTCSQDNTSPTIEERYRTVLQVDEEFNKLSQRLPSWITSKDCPSGVPPWVQCQWLSFRFSYAHMKMSVHRNFFCQYFTDKVYSYSHTACLDAARLILHTYQNTAESTIVHNWTTPAHVISASIISSLNFLLSNDGEDFTTGLVKPASDDADAISQCIGLVTSRAGSNLLVRRGVILVDKLLQQKKENKSFNDDDVAQLVRDIDAQMRDEDSAVAVSFNLTFDDFLGLLNNDFSA